MKFQAEVLSSGKTATGIQVPDEVVAALGAGKRPPVRATVNGYTYRNTVASMGGHFMLSVSAEVRERAGVAAGDIVDVELELDTAPRAVTVPPDFAATLAGDSDARQRFDGLSYSKQLRLVLDIEGAKTEETRARRVTKALATLREARA